MTTNDPIPTETVDTPAPDATPKTEPETGDDAIDRLNLPNVPEQHEVDPPIENAPVIEAPYGFNKDGTPAKKRGRKAASGADVTPQFDRLDSATQAPPLPSAKSSEKGTRPVIPSVNAVVTDYRAMGMLAASMWIKGGAVIFGVDWAPNMDDPLEKEQPKELADAFTGYFKAKEVQALSPEWALVIVLTSYTISKAQKPTVTTRFGRMIQWIKSKAKR